MLDESHPIVQLWKRDKRYRLDAYAFIFEALNYAQSTLGMGVERIGGEDAGSATHAPASAPIESEDEEEEERIERHVSGQDLCEAIRRLALDQYGLMAKCVLNSWGIHNTGDFGNIVFNLIEIGQMRKTEQDRREDFENVFDFDAGLRKGYRIKLPKAAKN